MEDLLQKISYVFTVKIKEIVQLNNIFSRTATEAYDLATNCEKLLLAWKKTYMATRAFIENSGVGSRWEFDKGVLFSDVEHCARISRDIANVAQVINKIHYVHGNEIISNDISSYRFSSSLRTYSDNV